MKSSLASSKSSSELEDELDDEESSSALRAAKRVRRSSDGIKRNNMFYWNVSKLKVPQFGAGLLKD